MLNELSKDEEEQYCNINASCSSCVKFYNGRCLHKTLEDVDSELTIEKK